MAETIKIGGELESTATGNKVADVANIKDKTKGNKSQSQINAELETALNDRYTKAETYNKTELNNMITTPNQEYETYNATDQTTDVTDVLPATGEADTVYRVGNWDGSQFDASAYSEYAWNGSSYVHLNTKTQVGEVFDISAYHATGGTLATYADLSAALDSNNGGGVPQSLQEGGMSVKYVRTYDHKYVQARLMAQNFTTDVTQWQGVDDEPTIQSKNLVTSGGVGKVINGTANYTIGKILANNGVEVVDSSYCYSDYIQLTAEAKTDGVTAISKVTDTSVPARVVLYDNNKHMVAWYGYTSNGTKSISALDISDNSAEYIRMSFLKVASDDVKLVNLSTSTIYYKPEIIGGITNRIANIEDFLNNKDSVPIENSTELVTSGGVYQAIQDLFEDAVLVLGKDDTPYNVLNAYIKYDDGTTVASDNFNTRVFDTQDVEFIHCKCGYNTNGNYAIAFYSSADVNVSSLITDGSIRAASGVHEYEIAKEDIPDNAVVVAISNRTASLSDEDHIIELMMNPKYSFNKDNDIIKSINAENEVFAYSQKLLYSRDITAIPFVQGGYNSGIPNASSARVRLERMIIGSDLPMTIEIPSTVNARFYGYSLYAKENDYTSYLSYTSIPAGNKKLDITQELCGSAKGITVMFANATSISSNIAPSDMNGTLFYWRGSLDSLNDAIESATKTCGNQVYYGRIQTLKITDERHKLTSSVKLTHVYSEYSHTKYNQSMAVWDDKYFFFNDTSRNDGFCVVIDMATNNVLEHITEIPAEIGASHLNNAVFTDIYYDSTDKYPLLILSRGDYATGSASDEAFHVVRVTEENGHFVFTHIKKVLVNTRYSHFNASFCYDRERKMIWCYSFTQDWRYYFNSTFNMTSVIPVLSQSQYIAITSKGAVAATSADIVISVDGGAHSRTIHVDAGDEIDEIFAFSPNSLGYNGIYVHQNADAFDGKWVVYECDENGNNRELITCEAVLSAFNCPDLLSIDSTSLTDSDIISKSFIDMGIFQGGDCANGKLYLPYQQYDTVNGQPTSYTGHCCMVVNPCSGYIESIIPTDVMENEGCSIYKGCLYISLHNGNATGSATSFKIIEYSFD